MTSNENEMAQLPAEYEWRITPTTGDSTSKMLELLHRGESVRHEKVFLANGTVEQASHRLFKQYWRIW